jgi:hypothetical protein
VALAHRTACFGVAMKSSIIAWAALAVMASACARDNAKPAKPQQREQNAPTQAAAMPPAHDALPNTAGGELIEGTVLDALQVPEYTYLKLKVSDGTERWVAIATKAIARAAKVTILAETQLTQFESKTLHRTFDAIAFGSVYSPATTTDGTACGGDTEATQSHGVLAGHVHGSKNSDTTDVSVKPVPRAPGKNGHTVSEILSMREALSGKRVRLRATVVKATYDVLGKTFIHLRDGTGDSRSSTNDLAVTTALRPNKGDTLLLEGTLAVNEDFGSGYRFDALLEDAEVVTP